MVTKRLTLLNMIESALKNPGQNRPPHIIFVDHSMSSDRINLKLLVAKLHVHKVVAWEKGGWTGHSFEVLRFITLIYNLF